MSGSLVIYSSTDGHTERICRRIVSFMNSEKKTTIVSLKEANKFKLSEFNKVIIGASIRYGKHSKELYKFIEINKDILDQKETFFFSVNVVARKPEKNSPETNPYIKKFLKISGLKPKKIEVFAGKVDYPNYGLIDKYVIKFIMFLTKGPTDTSRSFEFTDWQKVDNFAKQLKLSS